MADDATADTTGSSPDAADDNSPDGATEEEAIATAEAGSSPDEAEAEAEPTEGEDDSSQEESPEFQRLLAKHRGDKAAVARDVWETKRSARVLKEENDELRAQLAQREERREREAPDDSTVDDTPIPSEAAEDLKWIASEVASLEQEREGYAARQSEILADLDTRRAAIAKIEGRMEYATELGDGDRAAALAQQAQSAKDNYNRLVREYKDLNLTIGRTNRELAGRQKEKSAIERRIESGKLRSREAAETQLAEDRNVRATFAEMADDAADEFGYDTDNNGKPTPARQKFISNLKAAVIIRLRSLQGSASRGQKVNLARVITDEIDGYRDVLKVGRGKDFRSYSKDKQQANQRTAPKEAARRIAPPLPKEVDDPNYWKRRAAKILG